MTWGELRGGRAVARRIGLPEGVAAGLYDVHEWWNGRGVRGVREEEIARPARFARVTTDAAVLGGIVTEEDVVARLRRRAGKTLDPRIVDAFAANAESLAARDRFLREPVPGDRHQPGGEALGAERGDDGGGYAVGAEKPGQARGVTY